MSRYLIPAYVQRAGWDTVAAYLEFLDTDDLDRLRDSITRLGTELARDPAWMLFAPTIVLEFYNEGLASDAGPS